MADSGGVDVGAQVLSELKRLNPARVVAVLADGEARAVAVPQRRRKWEAVLSALGALAWQRVELLTKAGELLGVVEQEAAGEVQLTPEAARVNSMLDVMLKAQDVALSRNERSFGQILEANTRLVDAMGARLAAMEATYAQVLKLAADATMALAQAQPNDSETMELLKVVLGGDRGPQALMQLASKMGIGGKPKLVAPAPTGEVKP